jgi:hypothetical protein
VQDAEPAARLGGRGIVVGRPLPREVRRARDLGLALADDLVAAAELIGPPAG